MELALTDAPDPSARDVIAAGLGVLNTERAGPGEWRQLAVLIRDEAGAVTGGLWGVTSYGWLFTELLFVPASLRGRGLGAEILGRAEAEAAVARLPRRLAGHLRVPGARVLRAAGLQPVRAAGRLPSRVRTLLHEEGAVRREAQPREAQSDGVEARLRAGTGIRRLKVLSNTPSTRMLKVSPSRASLPWNWFTVSNQAQWASTYCFAPLPGSSV